MASEESSKFRTDAPNAFDIVSCLYPSMNDTLPKLRPALVLNQFKDKKSGNFYCDVAFGTSSLKLKNRQHVDLIIQKSSDLNMIGLPRATRFDLDKTCILPWHDDFFKCWRGYPSPLIGSLTETYVKEYAYCMMVRHEFNNEAK